MRLLMICLLMLNLISSPAVRAAEGGEGEGEKASSGAASEYMEIKPALITNYGGAGPIHFLKAEITLRVGKDPEAAIKVTHHMPHIRHELVMLLSRQTEDTLATMQGKEQLRQDALSAVQKVLQDEEGKKIVEDLLFTNFVVQH